MSRRLKGLGVAAALIVVIVVVLILVLPGAGAPAVVGLTLDQARELAGDAGMKVEVTDQVPSFDKPAGTVLEQDPIPKAKSGDGTLRLTVTREPTPVKVTSLRDVDPEGDNTENPDQLPKLIDGKASTSWTTELYRSSTFGNLKTGVGLDFTLAQPASIVEIMSPVEGWKGELLQNISSGPAARLATLNGDTTQIITLGTALTSGRIWFTQLAQVTAGRWGVELSEIHFYQ